MELTRDKAVRRQNRIGILVLCILGLAVNIAGAQAAKALNLPLYLDNIGSALSAALGGFIPGIIVGFFTNLINGISDMESIYYSSLNVLIAVSSAYFAYKGDYGKLWKLPLIVLTFALIGGALGSLLTWTIYGFSFGQGVSAPLAHRFFDSGAMTEFWAQFTADMLIDLADKTITVAAVALVLRYLPEKIRRKVELTGWKQAPLSLKQRMKDSGFAHRRSLRLKIIFLVTAATLLTAAVVTGISVYHYREAAIDSQEILADDVLEVVIERIDGDRVDEYIEKGEEAEGYSEIKSFLKSMMDSSEYLEFCYVYRILEDGCQVVFDPDTDEVPGKKAGEMVDFDMAFEEYLPDLKAGREIPPINSNETYGWLLTFYRPVRDSNGVTQCYAAVDINLEHIATDGYRFLARVVSVFLGFFIMIMTVALWLAEYNVILPINGMAVT
ncbi:MAG: hypothetical protein K6E17_07120, partial [Clostridiales bacterium]|nr:hypothetical protein [Clostridiales bacterium]